MSYAYLFKYIIIGATHTQPDLLIAAVSALHTPDSPDSAAGDTGVGKSCLLLQFTGAPCTRARARRERPVSSLARALVV